MLTIVASWFFLVAIGYTAIILAGIIPGILPIFAESWYPGQGLKQGDYFRYNVCWTDHNNCAPFEIDFWVKSKTLDGRVAQGCRQQYLGSTKSSFSSKSSSLCRCDTVSNSGTIYF